MQMLNQVQHDDFRHSGPDPESVWNKYEKRLNPFDKLRVN